MIFKTASCRVWVPVGHWYKSLTDFLNLFDFKHLDLWTSSRFHMSKHMHHFNCPCFTCFDQIAIFNVPVLDFDLTQVVSNLFFSSRNLPPSNRDDRTVFGQSNVYFRIHRVQPQLFLYLSDTPDEKKKFQFPKSATSCATAIWTCRASNSNSFPSVWYWNGRWGKINVIFQLFRHKLFKRPPPIFIPWQIWSVRVLGVKIGDEGKQADAWKTWF